MSKEAITTQHDAEQLGKFGYQQELKRVLTLGQLIYYGLAYLVPLTIFTTFGLVTTMTHGMLSLTYAVATLAMTGPPPTGQSNPSNESAFTQAPANPAHAVLSTFMCWFPATGASSTRTRWSRKSRPMARSASRSR